MKTSDTGELKFTTNNVNEGTLLLGNAGVELTTGNAAFTIQSELQGFNGDFNSVTSNGNTGGFYHWEIGGYDLYIQDDILV